MAAALEPGGTQNGEARAATPAQIRRRQRSRRDCQFCVGADGDADVVGVTELVPVVMSAKHMWNLLIVVVLQRVESWLVSRMPQLGGPGCRAEARQNVRRIHRVTAQGVVAVDAVPALPARAPLVHYQRGHMQRAVTPPADSASLHH